MSKPYSLRITRSGPRWKVEEHGVLVFQSEGKSEDLIKFLKATPERWETAKKLVNVNLISAQIQNGEQS